MAEGGSNLPGNSSEEILLDIIESEELCDQQIRKLKEEEAYRLEIEKHMKIVERKQEELQQLQLKVTSLKISCPDNTGSIEHNTSVRFGDESVRPKIQPNPVLESSEYQSTPHRSNNQQRLSDALYGRSNGRESTYVNTDSLKQEAYTTKSSMHQNYNYNKNINYNYPKYTEEKKWSRYIELFHERTNVETYSDIGKIEMLKDHLQGTTLSLFRTLEGGGKTYYEIVREMNDHDLLHEQESSNALTLIRRWKFSRFSPLLHTKNSPPHQYLWKIIDAVQKAIPGIEERNREISQTFFDTYDAPNQQILNMTARAEAHKHNRYAILPCDIHYAIWAINPQANRELAQNEEKRYMQEYPPMRNVNLNIAEKAIQQPVLAVQSIANVRTTTPKDTNKFKKLSEEQYDQYLALHSEAIKKPIICIACNEPNHKVTECPMVLAKKEPCYFCNKKHFGICKAHFEFRRMYHQKNKRYPPVAQVAKPREVNYFQPQPTAPEVKTNYKTTNLTLSNRFDILRDEFEELDSNNTSLNSKVGQEADNISEPLKTGTVRNGYGKKSTVPKVSRICLDFKAVQGPQITTFEKKIMKSIEMDCYNISCVHNGKSKLNKPTKQDINNCRKKKVDHIKLISHQFSEIGLEHEIQISQNIKCTHDNIEKCDNVIMPKESVVSYVPIKGKTGKNRNRSKNKHSNLNKINENASTSGEQLFADNIIVEAKQSSVPTDVLDGTVLLETDTVSSNIKTVPKPENEILSQYFDNYSIIDNCSMEEYCFRIVRQVDNNSLFRFNVNFINNISNNIFNEQCIVDSGAQINLIDFDLAMKLNLTFLDTNYKIRGLGEDSKEYIAKAVHTPFDIEGVIMKNSQFLCIPEFSCPHKVILGRNFLCTNNATIDLKNNLLQFNIKNSKDTQSTVYTIDVTPGPGHALITVNNIPVYISEDFNPSMPGTYEINVNMPIIMKSKNIDFYNEYYDTKSNFYLSLNKYNKNSYDIDGQVNYMASQEIKFLSNGNKLNKDTCIGYVYSAEYNSKIHDDTFNYKYINAVNETVIAQNELYIDEFAKLFPPQKMDKFESEHSKHLIENPLRLTEDPKLWSEKELLDSIKINDKILDKVQLKTLTDILYKYRVAFKKSDETITPGILAEIEYPLTKDAKPHSVKPRRMPAHVNEVINKKVDEYLKAGVLVKNNSNWSSNVHLVTRFGSTKQRLVIDYRITNTNILKDAKYIVGVQDTIQNIGPKKYYSSFDLCSAYHLLSLKPGVSRDLTTIVTSRDTYSFVAAPFGVSRNPSAFSGVIQHLFAKMSKEEITTYLDDILLHNKTIEDHMQNLENLLYLCVRHRIKLNPTKTKIFFEEIEYLGFIISEKGIAKSPLQCERIKEALKPVTGKEMRSFIGVLNFQRNYIENCAKLVQPLNDAIDHKRPGRKICWTDEMHENWEKIKVAMVDDLRLAYPDYSSSEPLILYTDSSEYALGSSLTQKQGDKVRIISYCSQILKDAERRYSVIDKELLGIINGIKTHRHYLLGTEKQFIVRTDHEPLLYAFRSRQASPRLYRALSELGEYYFTVEYIKGKNNVVADFFSRNIRKLSSLDPLIKGCKNVDISEEFYIPESHHVIPVRGGGDSYLTCLIDSLSNEELRNLGLDSEVDKLFAFRRLTCEEVEKHHVRYGVPPNDKVIHRLISGGRSRGSLPTLYQMQAAATVIKRRILIYFGLKSPVVIAPHTSKKKIITDYSSDIKLQSLSDGLHYNLIVATTNKVNDEEYDQSSYIYLNEDLPEISIEEELLQTIESPEEIEVNIDPPQEIFEMNKLDEIPLEKDKKIIKMYLTGNNFVCDKINNHVKGDTHIQLNKKGDKYCCHLDTGSNISLITPKIINKIDGTKYKIKSSSSNENNATAIRAFDGNYVTVSGKIDLSLGDKTQSFLVVNEASLSNSCLLYGADYIRSQNIILKFVSNEILNENMSVNKIVAINNLNETTELHKKVRDTALNIDEAIKMQKNDKNINCLRRNYLLEQYPARIKNFQRYKKSLSVCDNGIIRYKNSVIITEQAFTSIAMQVHESYNHVGRARIMYILQKLKVWIPTLQNIIEDLLRACPICQMVKVNLTQPKPPINKIQACQPFDLIAADIVKLPMKGGYIGALTVADHCSKWVQAYAIKDAKTSTIVKLLEQQFLPSIPKCPQVFHSDNGPEFISKDMKEMLERHGISHMRSPAYNPHCSGLIENKNSALLKQIRAFCMNRPNDWPEYLQQAVAIYNHSYNSIIGRSPASYVYEKSHTFDIDRIVSKEISDTWRMGDPRFAAYPVGSEVLFKKKYIGDLTTNKVGPRYKGIYKINKVYSKGVMYEIEPLEGMGSGIKQVHYRDLRPFYRLKNKYLKNPGTKELYEKWWIQIFKSSIQTNFPQSEVDKLLREPLQVEEIPDERYIMDNQLTEGDPQRIYSEGNLRDLTSDFDQLLIDYSPGGVNYNPPAEVYPENNYGYNDEVEFDNYEGYLNGNDKSSIKFINKSNKEVQESHIAKKWETPPPRDLFGVKDQIRSYTPNSSINEKYKLNTPKTPIKINKQYYTPKASMERILTLNNKKPPNLEMGYRYNVKPPEDPFEDTPGTRFIRQNSYRLTEIKEANVEAEVRRNFLRKFMSNLVRKRPQDKIWPSLPCPLYSEIVEKPGSPKSENSRLSDSFNDDLLENILPGLKNKGVATETLGVNTSTFIKSNKILRTPPKSTKISPQISVSKSPNKVGVVSETLGESISKNKEPEVVTPDELRLKLNKLDLSPIFPIEKCRNITKRTPVIAGNWREPDHIGSSEDSLSPDQPIACNTRAKRRERAYSQ